MSDSERNLRYKEFPMAFWSGEKLEGVIPGLIEPFNPEAIDCAAYTLHVGDEVYVSPDREVASPSRHSKQKLSEGEAFAMGLIYLNAQ